MLSKKTQVSYFINHFVNQFKENGKIELFGDEAQFLIETYDIDAAVNALNTLDKTVYEPTKKYYCKNCKYFVPHTYCERGNRCPKPDLEACGNWCLDEIV